MDPAHPMRQLFVMVAGFIIWPVASALLGAVLARYYAKNKFQREAIYSVSVFVGLVLAAYIHIQ
ncbi:hypothetical protein N5D28_20810 [Stutzerimonas stutzeri]|uniref:hypothetical protein n=1 Tax=Stutzerimonas stutzeri TaxID=316 RepID=UPI00244CF53A|nr:hypothetical protein [Stutzerimonas stutzeri]MDH0611324.1 hypothetical protein [Stutzerimonas stutzeri]